MRNQMERFTENALEVLRLAQQEAERLYHHYIGTEHLLLGLIQNKESTAGRVLRTLGIEQDRVEALAERLTRASNRTSGVPLDLSPGTKKVLEKAFDEVRRLGHHALGTEHLLLGLAHQTEGVAIEVLKRLGIAPMDIIKEVQRLQKLQESPMDKASSTEPVIRLSQSVLYRLAVAFDEARLMQMQEVEVEHLLLSMLQADPDIWDKLGYNVQELDTLRATLRQSIEDRHSQ